MGFDALLFQPVSQLEVGDHRSAGAPGDLDQIGDMVEMPMAEQDEIGFNLIADMVQNPAFRQEEFDKEKRLALADIVGSLDDPETVARLAFASWLYGPHPYGRPVIGYADTIRKTSRDDLVAYFGNYYCPGNMVLVIAGDVDPKAARPLIEKTFGPLNGRALPHAARWNSGSVGRRMPRHSAYAAASSWVT